MKRLFVFLMLMVLPAAALTQTPTGPNTGPNPLNGNGLLALAEASVRISQGRGTDQDSLHSGVWQGFVIGVALTHDSVNPRVCLPEKSLSGQWMAVVLQYLRQNPAQLHKESVTLVREALQRAFPCPLRK
jgi:hypothetical protein